MTSDWPFEDPPNVATFTTVNVLERGYSILLVTHDSEDGAWQFLCGYTSDTSDARVIGLREALKLDDSLRQLADLPLGWRAKREKPGTPWRREPNPTH
jgi:hypothetical protein